MPTGTSTIDLGELPSGDDPDGPDGRPGGPGWQGWSRWRDPWRRWRWVAATVAGLLPLVTAIAAVPVRPYASLAYTLPLGYRVTVTHDDDRLYAVGSRTPVGGATYIAAYRFADGRVEWKVPLTASGPTWGMLHLVEGSLLFASSSTATGVTALDAATGRHLWQRRGWPIAVIEDRLLLREVVTETGPAAGSAAYRHVLVLTMVHARTGQVAWRQSLLHAAAIGDARTPYLVAQRADHRLTSYDLYSGALVASSPAPVDGVDLRMVNSLMLVRQPDGDPPAVTAYSVEQLQFLWTAVIEPDSWTVDCGPVICVYRAGRLDLLDRISGDVVWSRLWRDTRGEGLYRLPHPSRRDVLVIDTHGGGQQLVAATTGELLLDLAGWRLPRPGGSVLDRAEPIGDVLVTRQEGARSWLGRVRLDGPGVEVVGTFDGALPSCTLTGEHAVCLGDAGREAQVWRIYS